MKWKNLIFPLSLTLAGAPSFAGKKETKPLVEDPIIDETSIPIRSAFAYRIVLFDPDRPFWLGSPALESGFVKIQIDMTSSSALLESDQGKWPATIEIDRDFDTDSRGYSGPSSLRITPSENSPFKAIELNLDRSFEHGKEMISFRARDGWLFKVQYGDESIPVVPFQRQSDLSDPQVIQELAVRLKCHEEFTREE